MGRERGDAAVPARLPRPALQRHARRLERATSSVTNDTAATFASKDSATSRQSAFGLMLFRTGSHAELEQRNKSLTLPALRRAMTSLACAPDLARTAFELDRDGRPPHGALPAGLWVRLVFGAFVPKGAMPESLSRQGVRDGVDLDHRSRHRLSPR